MAPSHFAGIFDVKAHHWVVVLCNVSSACITVYDPLRRDDYLVGTPASSDCLGKNNLLFNLPFEVLLKEFLLRCKKKHIVASLWSSTHQKPESHMSSHSRPPNKRRHKESRSWLASQS